MIDSASCLLWWRKKDTESIYFSDPNFRYTVTEFIKCKNKGHPFVSDWHYISLVIYMVPMGKRGPKTQFTNVSCPNKECELYGQTGQENVTGNGTYISRGEKTRRYICHHCGKAFCDHTGTFYHDLRKDENTIDLALKMSMKGMSIEAIAEVLEVDPASVKRWLARATEQCDKVNDTMMKDLNVPRIEMDEMWVIVKKSSSKNGSI